MISQHPRQLEHYAFVLSGNTLNPSTLGCSERHTLNRGGRGEEEFRPPDSGRPAERPHQRATRSFNTAGQCESGRQPSLARDGHSENPIQTLTASPMQPSKGSLASRVTCTRMTKPSFNSLRQSALSMSSTQQHTQNMRCVSRTDQRSTRFRPFDAIFRNNVNNEGSPLYERLPKS